MSGELKDTVGSIMTTIVQHLYTISGLAEAIMRSDWMVDGGLSQVLNTWEIRI